MCVCGGGGVCSHTDTESAVSLVTVATSRSGSEQTAGRIAAARSSSGGPDPPEPCWGRWEAAKMTFSVSLDGPQRLLSSSGSLEAPGWGSLPVWLRSVRTSRREPPRTLSHPPAPRTSRLIIMQQNQKELQFRHLILSLKNKQRNLENLEEPPRGSSCSIRSGFGSCRGRRSQNPFWFRHCCGTRPSCHTFPK